MDKNIPTTAANAYTTALSRFGYYTSDMLEDGLLQGVYGDEGGLKYPPDNNGKWDAEESLLRGNAAYVPFFASPSAGGNWVAGGPVDLSDRSTVIGYADDRNLSHLVWGNPSGFNTYLNTSPTNRDLLRRRVGSRLVLTRVSVTVSVPEIAVSLAITNEGTSPDNYVYPINLVLVSLQNGSRLIFPLTPNARSSIPQPGGSVVLNYTVPKSPTLEGKYRVLIHLPDADPLLTSPDYARRFASNGLGFTTDGMNDPSLTVDFSAITGVGVLPPPPTIDVANSGQNEQVNVTVSNLSPFAASWEIRYKVNAGDYGAPISIPATSSSIGISGAAWDFGDTVVFQARAKNSTNGAGIWGVPVSVTLTQAVPEAPGNFFIVWSESNNRFDATLTDRQNTVSLKYRYNVNGGAWSSYTGIPLASTFQVANPGSWVNGDLITFELVGVNAAGDSLPAEDSDTVTIGGVQPPTNLQIQSALFNQVTNILTVTFVAFPSGRNRVRLDVQDGTEWLPTGEIVSSVLTIEVPNPGTWVNGDNLRLAYRAEDSTLVNPPTVWLDSFVPIVISGGGASNPYLGTYRATQSEVYPTTPTTTVNPSMSEAAFIAAINSVPSGGSVGFESGIYPYYLPARPVTFFPISRPNIVDNKDAMPVTIRSVNRNGVDGASGMKLMGLRFDGVNAGEGGRGLSFSGISDLLIQDCVFTGWKAGVVGASAIRTKIFNSIFVNMGHATALIDADCLKIINSQLTEIRYSTFGYGRKTGVNLFGSTGSILEEVASYKNGYSPAGVFLSAGVGIALYQATISKVRLAFCGQRAAGGGFGIDADAISSANQAIRDAASTKASRVSIYNPAPFGVAMFFQQGNNHHLTDSLIHEAKLNGARLTNESGTVYGITSGVFGSVTDFTSSVLPSIKTLNDINWLRATQPPYQGKGG